MRLRIFQYNQPCIQLEVLEVVSIVTRTGNLFECSYLDMEGEEQIIVGYMVEVT